MSARFSPPPRVTHLVLVDGLPVDSWVVAGPDAASYADRYRQDDYGDRDDRDHQDHQDRDDRYRRDARDDHRSWSGGGGSAAWVDGDDWSPDGPDRDPDTGRPLWVGRLESLGPPAPPGPSQEELRLLDLEELVGGADALTALDVEPLPVERLDPQAVPPDLQPVVEEVFRRCDEVVDRWFDEETRTVLHRLVAVIVAERPDVLADPDVARSAASLCWMVGRGNGFVGPVFGSHVVTNKALLEHFRQPQNLVEQFAARLLPKTPVVPVVGERWAAGGQGWRPTRTRPRSDYLLGRPDWLVARRRLAIARERDELLRQLADRAAAEAAITPVITAATVDPPPLETAGNPDDRAPEWERSLRLLNGG